MATSEDREFYAKHSIRFPLLLRVLGIAAILLAVLGILLGGVTSLIVMTLDFDGLSEWGAEALKFQLSRMRKIMSAPEFKVFFYSMVLFGLAFNSALLVLGWSFARLRARGIWPFISLMVVFALYINGLPRIIDTGSDEVQIYFGSAWGAANMGLAPTLISYFWIWGPALALTARGRIV